ncbi:MAG: C10 family peptidase [Bacteroidaceae bacterium]|nr:C10 family peptidase [Bacteroidaceae bacterium]
MKRIISLFLTLCIVFTTNAEPVGKQAAQYSAQAFMLARGKNINTVQKPFKARKATTAQETDEGDAYYYVFNAGNDGGYVIVSGDDRTESILGYVDQGSFDPENIPENMSSWLQSYADQIKYIIDNDIQPSDPIIKKRNKVSGTRHSIPELLKTRWNQGRPYNITCPMYYKEDGSQDLPATGCAATAMAQVVAFYKFPEKTKANIPALTNTYTLKDGSKKESTAPAIPRNTVIDWENMRDTYSWPSDHVANAQDSAVANLMLICGQSIKMGYGASSGGVTSRARDTFVNHLGFDSRAFWADRSDFSIDDWFNMLYDELEAGYPILYRGHSSKGGHAFVVDGFDGEGLFHLNWGWGGGSNGWFLISILNPGDNSGIGASSSSDGYSMTQGAVFNLRVPGTPKEDAYLNTSNVSLTTTGIKATFTNRTGVASSYHVGILMLNEDGSLSLVGNRQAISSLANGSSSTKSFVIAKKLPEGTYKLSPANKPSRSEEWRTEYDFLTQYIEAQVDSAGAVTMNFHKPIFTGENLSIDTIVFPGTRIAGQEQEIKVTFRNNGAEYFKTIYLFAGKGTTKTYTESKSMVAVRSGETADVSYFFKPEETGTYNLWFCTDDKGTSVMGQGTMEVITDAEAEKASLTVSKYAISNMVNNILYGKRLIGTATIRNSKATDYHGGVKVQIYTSQDGDNTAYSGASRTFYVDIPGGKTANVDFEFENLSAGINYHLKVMYTNQSGTLGNGATWDHKWKMNEGLLNWKTDGTVTGKAWGTTITTTTNICGVMADCKKITRMIPNRLNPNVIYAFGAGMELPAAIDTANVVIGNHADRINMVNDKPYYIPISFDADSASFAYTFPETEKGTGWHAFTMPFMPDSIYLDDNLVSLDDSLNHFWIYEFAAETANGEVLFKPATMLRSGTPYIIAADSTMAGRALVFRSSNVPFYKTGSDKMLVTSVNYEFHGNTFAPRIKDCYVLNEEGTAFEYITVTKTIDAQAPFFTTDLLEELRLESIVLPEIPVSKEEDPTNINSLKANHTADEGIYNLAGQRLSRMQKGINIVGGRIILK